jgi:hypothetical protein
MASQDLDLSGELSPRPEGGASSSSSSSSAAAAAAPADLPAFGEWTDQVERMELWNSVCSRLLAGGNVTKDAAKAIIKRLATERRLFNIPPGAKEKTTAAAYGVFLKYISSTAKSLPKNAKEVFAQLGGEGGSEAHEPASVEWTVHNMHELHAKIKEVEGAGRQLAADKAKREEEHAAQLKKLKATAAAATKKEDAALASNSKEKLELDAILLRLTKQMQEDAASEGGAGGGGGGGSGTKRRASMVSSSAKKAKSLAELLTKMRKSEAGLAALEQLEGTEVNGTAALEDDKATGKPLTVDELEDNLKKKEFTEVKAEFLADLIRYNVVTEFSEEDEEDDKDDEGEGEGEEE